MDSVSSRSSRATSVNPSCFSVVRLRRSSSSAMRSRRSRSASSWRSPTSFGSTRAILRRELEQSRACADDDRVGAEPCQEALDGTRPGLERRDTALRSELRERYPGERLGSVCEDSDLELRRGERAQRSARGCVAAEVGGGAILAEALEQRAPVPRLTAIEG